MTSLTHLPEWQALVAHHHEMNPVQMRDLFQIDPNRFAKFSLEAAELFLDYSKNRITAKTMDLLNNLARARNLTENIDALFNGEPVNTTENRAALHTALRNLHEPLSNLNGLGITHEIKAVLGKMANFIKRVREGSWLGYSGKVITDVINIGVGGSDLGPAMVTEALAGYRTPALNFHFISNIDSEALSQTLGHLNPETCLFIISSKSFTTQETITNTKTIQAWFRQKTTPNVDLTHHFIAVTANVDEACEFGISVHNIFPIWDWVGGRYSIWSAIGLPVALAIGMENFLDFLHGAYAMDQHFRSAPMAENMPIILGLLSIWYNNFFDAKAQAILPYAQTLQRLPAYLQQAEMESNGKSVTLEGKPVSYNTGAVIFGEPGTNGQHAFYQLLHQGTQLIPVDFIIPLQSQIPIGQHHPIQVANAFSQSKALMEGKSAEEITQEMHLAGEQLTDIQRLTAHKVLLGNRPSNTILFSKISPHNLGALLALYEHKIFVQSCIWNIDPFDQWGVEYGKKLTHAILPDLLQDHPELKHDCSTNGLITYYHKAQTS